MLKPYVYFVLLLTALPGHALETKHIPLDQLHALGRELAERAGSSQWQQLWQRVRQSGQLERRSPVLHFDVVSSRLPDLARRTLADADEVIPQKRTQARYRKDFRPVVIGRQGARSLTALCIVVDWRSLPDGAAQHRRAYLGTASLLNAYPCE